MLSKGGGRASFHLLAGNNKTYAFISSIKSQPRLTLHSIVLKTAGIQFVWMQLCIAPFVGVFEKWEKRGNEVFHGISFPLFLFAHSKKHLLISFARLFAFALDFLIKKWCNIFIFFATLCKKVNAVLLKIFSKCVCKISIDFLVEFSDWIS